MSEDTVGLWLVGILVAASFAALLMLADAEEKKWIAFAESHRCQVVGRKAAQSVPTFVSTNKGGGIGFTTIPAQTGYSCDDGVTYWR